MVSSRNKHSRIAHYIGRMPIVYATKKCVYKQWWGTKTASPLAGWYRNSLFASMTTRCIATHYFSGYLYKSGIDNYLDYVSHSEWAPYAGRRRR